MIDSVHRRCGDVESLVAGSEQSGIANSIRSLETRLSTEQAKRRVLKAELEKRCDSLDALGKQACHLAEQVNSHVDNIQNSAQLMEKLELKLNAAEELQLRL